MNNVSSQHTDSAVCVYCQGRRFQNGACVRHETATAVLVAGTAMYNLMTRLSPKTEEMLAALHHFEQVKATAGDVLSPEV